MSQDSLIETRISTLDEVLGGGIPVYSLNIIAGPPGAGKTILAQELIFNNIIQKNSQNALYLSTLSEPLEKIVRFMQGFSFFNPEYFGEKLIYQDIGNFIRNNPLDKLIQHIQNLIIENNVEIVVIDSFKAIRDMVQSVNEFRLFCFDLSVNLANNRVTTFLLGEYSRSDIEKGAEFAIADGIIYLDNIIEGNQRRRYIEVLKLRNANHFTGKSRMEITGDGIKVFYFSMYYDKEENLKTYLAFKPFTGVLKEDPGHGTTWLVRGEPGVGKSRIALQFAIEGLVKKENVLYITSDTKAEQVIKSLNDSGFLISPYLESGQFLLFDFYSQGIKEYNMGDPEAFLFALANQIDISPKPCRVILDSITPLTLLYEGKKFVRLVNRKNSLLGRDNVVIFDTILAKTVEENDFIQLSNSYDMVVDMFTPDWGQMKMTGNIGYRALQFKKARGVKVDKRPFPYTISLTDGIVVQKDYYETQRDDR